jgi:hypothetical protein
MTVSDAFIGTWILVPELSLYEWGPLPVTCTYVIAPTGAEIEVEMRYTVAPGGEEQVVTYGGPVDGTPQILPAGAGTSGPDSYALVRIDERTLDSTAMRGNQILAYARRVVSSDRQLMAIVQQGQRPDGPTFRNFQVYRRGAV